MKGKFYQVFGSYVVIVMPTYCRKLVKLTDALILMNFPNFEQLTVVLNYNYNSCP
jgi:hypothetical protein